MDPSATASSDGARSYPVSRLGRLACWCYTERRKVLVLWVVGLIVITGASQVWHGVFENKFNGGNSESAHAQTLLSQRFPSQAGDDAHHDRHTHDCRRCTMRFLAAFAICGCAWAQIDRPQIGKMLDANGAVRTVYGIEASVSMGDVETNGVLSSGCAEKFCLVKTETLIVSAVGSVAAPGGAALFAFDGNAAFVWFPRSRELARWGNGVLSPLPYGQGSVAALGEGDGEVLSIRADVSTFASVLSARWYIVTTRPRRSCDGWNVISFIPSGSKIRCRRNRSKVCPETISTIRPSRTATGQSFTPQTPTSITTNSTTSTMVVRLSILVRT